MSEALHITHIQGLFSVEHGGPAFSTQNYINYQVAHGQRVSLRTLEGYKGASPAIRLQAPVDEKVFPVDFPEVLAPSRGLRRQLELDTAPDVYHNHGIWLLCMHDATRIAIRRRVPCIIEMMGSYEPWELRNRRLAKMAVRLLYQDRDLREASCLHVNSLEERIQLRKLGFQTPIAVIPVGVDTDRLDLSRALSEPPRAEWVDLAESPFVLFLARIHPKKGLHLLIEVWARLAAEFKNWRLVIAGAGLSEHTQPALELISKLGLERRCIWIGPVNHEEKTWLYRKAALYTLPSYFENFGNTIAEALACGTPVLTTPHAPWTDLARYGCGWQVAASLDEVSNGLRAALSLSLDDLREMGRRGQKLVDEKYSVKSVGAALDQLYRWVCGGPKPESLLS